MPERPLVSVILPIYRQQDALDLTFESLGRQDHESYEIIVVDDGSEMPIVAPASINDISIRVVRQDRDAFGLARARNTGATTAAGEILIFLDCDMIPERGFVSAHARHHATCDHAVVVGRRRHVDVAGITPEQVAGAAAANSIAGLFADRPSTSPAWIETHLERTTNLTAPAHDRWRVMSGGNLSVRKTLWDLVGGADASFKQWGGEDNETAYRLLAAGAHPVYEPDALAWHQGDGAEPSERERRSLRQQRARLEQLIADTTVREPRSGRTFSNPQTVLRLQSSEWPDDVMDAVVRSVLAGDESDVLIEVEAPNDDLWLRRRHDGETRVAFVASGSASIVPFPFLRVTLPGPFAFSARTLDSLVGRFRSGEVGTVRAALAGGGELIARLQRLEGRLDRLGVEHRDQVASELMGEVVLEGAGIGLRPVEGGETFEREGGRARITELETRITELAAQVTALQNRKIVRWADRIGRLRS